MGAMDTMFGGDVLQRAACSTEEKRTLLPLACQLMEFAQIAHRSGVLELEFHRDEVASPFLRNGLEMVIDGFDPGKIHRIVATEILMENKQGIALLERLLMHEVLMSIRDKDHPRITHTMIAAMLGADLHAELNAQRTLTEEQKEQAQAELDDFLQQEFGPQSGYTSTLEHLAGADDRAICAIISEVETSSLERALAGAGSGVVHAFLRNVSVRVKQQFRAAYERYKDLPEQEIRNAQFEVLCAVESLVQEGRIVEHDE